MISLFLPPPVTPDHVITGRRWQAGAGLGEEGEQVRTTFWQTLGLLLTQSHQGHEPRAGVPRWAEETAEMSHPEVRLKVQAPESGRP